GKIDVSACNNASARSRPGIDSSKSEGRARMRTNRALATALALSFACAAQAEGAPTWYVGAAGGASHVSLACEPGLACDRTGPALKIYGGLEWANRTGAEIMYEDFGKTSAGAIDALAVTDATIEPRALGLGVFVRPEITQSLSAKFKVGATSVLTPMEGTS